MPCVGLIVLAGCLTFIVVPDDEHSIDHRLLATSSTALPTIVIDPGHGGNDDGAKANGLIEKELTLDVAKRLDKILRVYNFPTVLTRSDDKYVALSDRVAAGNKIDDSLFVSIHFNQSRSGAVGGVETFYADRKVPPEQEWTWIGFFDKPVAPPADNGETLAGFIQASLVMKMESSNRGLKTKMLYVVRHTRAPAVLVEGGFLSNPLEAQLLKNADYKDRLAAAVAEGIVSYQRTRPTQRSPILATSASSTKF
jgi:N-acetylmuramoyl-L-alanine amidase